MLTAVSDPTRASTVGTMTQPRLRISARPSAGRSRSPDEDAATGFGAEGAGLTATRCTTGSLLPARQKAKRIAYSRGRQLLVHPSPVRVHSIMVAAGLIRPFFAGHHHGLLAHGHFLLTIKGLNRPTIFFRTPKMRSPPAPIPCMVAALVLAGARRY